MRELRVMTLGSEDRILSNVCDYFSKKPEDEQMNLLEVIDYINEHASQINDDCPSVYVGSYGKYNGCGDALFGMWVNLASFDDYESFLEFCKALHSDEPDVELMLQDYEGFPHSWYSESGIGEYFDKILEFAAIEDPDAAYIYINELGNDDVTGFKEAYMGEWESEEDFAWHIYEEFYKHEMSEFAQNYFNIKSFARDLFDDEFYFSDGHVFRRN